MKLFAPKATSSAGFTLIELMIVVAIIPIVTIPLATMLNFYPPVFAQIEQDRQMADQARAALSWLGRDIRSASSVLQQAGPYVTRSDGTLVLMPGQGSAKLVVWTVHQGMLLRLEFADAKAERETDRVILATPRAKLAVDLPKSGATVDVTVSLSRTVMDRERSVRLSGLFAQRARP